MRLKPGAFPVGREFKRMPVDNANLEGANFSGCVFNGVSFHNANLRHAELDKCVFSETDFSGADLSFARGTSYFMGNISLDSARVKSACLVLHCSETSLAPDAQVKGRLISENGAVKFLPDSDAEKNVENWREWCVSCNAR